MSTFIAAYAIVLVTIVAWVARMEIRQHRILQSLTRLESERDAPRDARSADPRTSSVKQSSRAA